MFVGAEKLRHGPNNPPYTVNDAVDLAHALTVDHGLMPLDQAWILLSGEPSGASSRRYDQIQGDALIGSATKVEIESALKAAAEKVGKNGVLYVFIATHGASDGKTHFLMAQDTDPEQPDTAISVEWILEATRASRGQIVLFLDTCRVISIPSPDSPRAVQAQNSEPSEPRGFVPGWLTEEAQARHSGYAILFATGLGHGAGPDPRRLNGVFTGALLDGLQCRNGGGQPRISLGDLASFVQMEVPKRSRGGAQKPELLTAAGFRNFIVVRCCAMDILEPKDGDVVDSSGSVRLHVCEPGLYAKAVILAEQPGVYFLQHPEMDFFLGSPDSDFSIPVDYGAPDRFQVYVAIGADPELLGRDNQISRLSTTDPKGQPIRWLGPVHVTLPKKLMKKGDPR